MLLTMKTSWRETSTTVDADYNILLVAENVMHEKQAVNCLVKGYENQNTHECPGRPKPNQGETKARRL